ncbi:MAG: TetR family transcriptional regulator [Actinophytocola sp.]|uniref:TetR/AcrR family transcriptional regulator n=1 Tax=Actinophytocola sp. TaxID=1872138 RepID=UPI001323723B|nr:TetR/AcrR family transcriptional regulator [Actinophytocola sp.]MPZ80325.1 TetR family transcriptional regulator [Actinophytocola sp.]
MTDTRTDGRTARGDRTRRRILRRAADIASTDGLDGLSLAGVARDLDISKSGVLALFGSKQDLQLATIRTAVQIFRERVVEPAMTVPAGLRRLSELCENQLDYSRSRVFPGGCFFSAVSAEFDAKPGPVHDLIAASVAEWTELIEHTAEQARHAGELAPDADPAQLAFELVAFLDRANAMSVLHDDPTAYPKAMTAIHHRLNPRTRRYRS